MAVLIVLRCVPPDQGAVIETLYMAPPLTNATMAIKIFFFITSFHLASDRKNGLELWKAAYI